MVWSIHGAQNNGLEGEVEGGVRGNEKVGPWVLSFEPFLILGNNIFSEPAQIVGGPFDRVLFRASPGLHRDEIHT